MSGQMQVFRPDGRVLREYCRSSGFVQLVMGPWGSGKTAASVVGKMWKCAVQQARGNDGLRRTRWFVVRNTYTDLKNTTLNTWKDWFPESVYGEITMQRPFRHHIKIGDIDMEVLFLALDDEDDRKKLLSLECTGIYFNEFREIERGIIDDATGRVGRYPSKKYKPADIADDKWPTWFGVIGDTNAPSEDHWFPIMAGHVPMPDSFTDDDIAAHTKPDNWEFYFQPPAMKEVFDGQGKLTGYEVNPDAENLSNLPPGYYDNMIRAKKPSWIQINVLNRYGKLVEGKPVFETFREAIHVCREPIAVVGSGIVYVGIDFGRTPAAVFGQQVGGQYRIIGELQAYNMGADRFAPILRRYMSANFAGCPFVLYGDPAGDDEGQASDDTPFSVFRANGLRVMKAYHNNKLNVRLECVEKILGKNNDYNTGPALLIDPKCKNLISALNGGYQYRRLRVSGSAKYSDVPDKNQYSHIADAFQYLLLGCGEGRALLNNSVGGPGVRKVGRGRNINERRRAGRR